MPESKGQPMKRTTTEQYDIRGILEEMRDDYRRAVEVGEEESVTATRDYVIFTLGNELYGIESRFSREVLRLPRFVPVPRLPEHFVGLFNLRGQIHAITDLRPLFGLPRQAVAATHPGHCRRSSRPVDGPLYRWRQGDCGDSSRQHRTAAN